MGNEIKQGNSKQMWHLVNQEDSTSGVNLQRAYWNLCWGPIYPDYPQDPESSPTIFKLKWTIASGGTKL